MSGLFRAASSRTKNGYSCANLARPTPKLTCACHDQKQANDPHRMEHGIGERMTAGRKRYRIRKRIDQQGNRKPE